MERIKISVVIPSYKTEEEVMTRTIESVLSQSYKPHEVIVVDDNGGNEYSVMNRNLSLKYSASVRFCFYKIFYSSYFIIIFQYFITTSFMDF